MEAVVPALLGSVAAVAASWAALESMDWYRGRARRQRVSRTSGQRQPIIAAACCTDQALSHDAWRRVINVSLAQLVNRVFRFRQT